MRLGDTIAKGETKGSDYPRFKGSVKITLKDEITGEVKTVEKHNLQTDALPDIFKSNYGGLVNYSNFADLYSTYLGGVLVFADPLDTDPTSYGIPAQTSNACVAHAGQVPLTSQSDDTTRGNPDDTKLVLTQNSVKLVWTWLPSAGNAQRISAIGLTHSDVGSYGCGVKSTAQLSLNPFANVASINRQYAYGDNATCPLAIDGNTAYNVYLVNGETVHLYKTPINNTAFSMQGGALVPRTDYTETITATLPNSYATTRQGYYYWFDFDNNKLVLFGVPTQGGTTLYRDDIDLTTGNVTHSSITVTGAQLWKFNVNSNKVYDTRPTKAIVYNNHLYIYGYTNTYTDANKIFIVNLASTGDITEVDMSDFSDYRFSRRLDSYDAFHVINEDFVNLGGIIVHKSFLINGDKLYPVQSAERRADTSSTLATGGIVAPNICPTGAENVISVCKLYLATKFNLDTPVEKTPTQSMTIEYTLTQAN